MNEENGETTPQIEQETVVPETTEPTPQESKELRSALIQKDHFRDKAEKAEQERKELENKLNKLQSQGAKPALDVNDYIDISASLEGLDQREKERLAREHQLTGRPLAEIRKDEDFKLWQSAYRDKTEKEKLALKPSGTQPESDSPRTLNQKLANASLDEQEKLLSEAGLYKSARPKADRANIGGYVTK